MQVTMTINGTEYSREVEPRLLLIHFLRDSLGLTGSHWGCDTSNCGACVIWLDETPVKSCTVLTAMADGHRLRTVEGLAMKGAGEAGGGLDPVQQGFAECHGLQCGFCTPGMMLTARWLLDHNPDPTPEQIREALSGQVCRCTGYENIVRSVRWAAEHEAAVADRLAAAGPGADEREAAAGPGADEREAAAGPGADEREAAAGPGADEREAAAGQDAVGDEAGDDSGGGGGQGARR